MLEKSRGEDLGATRAEPVFVMAMDEKPCPFCAETIKTAALKCRHCGEMLGASPTGSLQPQVVVNNVITQTVTAPALSLPLKSRTTAAILALFFGGVGIHKFYIGRPIMGFLYFLFCLTFIPAVLGFLEAITYLSYKSDEDFTRRVCA